jgi:hypothetical protein
MDSDCESFQQKMIGKPYSRKSNVRFDEGELEIGPQLVRQLSTLPKPWTKKLGKGVVGRDRVSVSPPYTLLPKEEKEEKIALFELGIAKLVP